VAESDHFVVGVLLVEHLIGANPFDGGNVHEILKTIREIDGVPSSARLSLLPEELRGIVGSLMSAVPVERRSGWRDLLTFLGVSERDCV
jgi:hypothetical protein